VSVRVIREMGGFRVYIVQWDARFSWRRDGHFVNGSKWFSGWHRWMEDDLV